MRGDAVARDREFAHAVPQTRASSGAVNFRILRAVLEKDVRSLLPLVALTALLFLGDAVIVRLDLLPLWSMWGTAVLLVAFAVLIISVFQLDSPAGPTDDWLCRPVRKRELLGAKLLLILSAVYLPHAVGAFIADVRLGYSWPESSLDSVLLPDKLFIFLLPLLMFVAIVTRTFVQAFGVLFAIFLCVFALPTPFVRAPGPLDLGINDALPGSGMLWLATVPARLASFALVALGFWLVYWRRNLTMARALLGVTVVVTVFLVVLPTGLIPGKSTYASGTAFGPAPPAEAARLTLRSARTCFPAAPRTQMSTDAAFTAARRGARLWGDEALGDSGQDSIAFLTAIETRGLPLDWRVKLVYAQANYSADGVPLESLRPAHYITDERGGGSLVHAWMLPESTLRRLAGVQPKLQLTYSLTLLKPRDHDLPVDGKRHALPGLGWCGARVVDPDEGIDVDCFSAITHPTQISAQLNDIPASRVYGSVDFAPGWARLPYGEHVTLTIGSPRLAKHDTVTVTAWETAGFLDESLTLPGILGGDTETCPLPTKGGTRFQRARWSDTAPHDAQSITVEEGVQLEVLDFGGTGSPILLLPGLGATAHNFDELAPLLARTHRVVAMTRRGTGDSSRPDFGLDTPQLAQDVLTVMDAMGFDKVVLVGHSIAGDELTWLGGHHPGRFAGLIYLDAAYDRSGGPKAPAMLRLRELSLLMPPEPPIPPEALLSFDAMTELLLERGHLRTPEGELIAFRRMNDPNLAGTPNIDGRVQQAIAAAIEKPDYAAVKIPALAIYAFEHPDKPLPPWYDPNDPELRAAVAERARLMHDMKRASIELFREGVEHGRVLEMQNASHNIVLSNPREVLEAIEGFIAGCDPCSSPARTGSRASRD
jgi:pimeloyl-ACP methyl ester carboxylesterase